MNRRIAVPTAGGRVSAHFGRCENFTVVEVADGTVIGQESVTPPAHEPGAYPRFLAAHGVDLVLAGGMGAKARELFHRNGIEVQVGVAEDAPLAVVARYLADGLDAGANTCSHESGEGDHSDCSRRP